MEEQVKILIEEVYKMGKSFVCVGDILEGTLTKGFVLESSYGKFRVVKLEQNHIIVESTTPGSKVGFYLEGPFHKNFPVEIKGKEVCLEKGEFEPSLDFTYGKKIRKNFFQRLFGL